MKSQINAKFRQPLNTYEQVVHYTVAFSTRLRMDKETVANALLILDEPNLPWTKDDNAAGLTIFALVGFF